MSFMNDSETFENGTDIHAPPEPPVLKKALDIILITIVLLIMLAMGCTITLSEIWNHLKKPISILIGMISQFIILPLCGFGLSHALSLKANVAVGMLVLSCCPGGTMSNLFTYWNDGDVSLSVAMTTFSTLLSFGMMPLNLWMYSKSWTSEEVKIPYVKICITLASILGPVIVGMIIRRFLPKCAEIISKIGSFVGMFGILIALIIQSILFPGMYSSSWNIWVCAAVFPFLGLSLGFGFAKLTRRNLKVSKAIGFETGSQNVALAVTVLFITFPYNVLAEATSFPQLYTIVMLMQYGIFSAIYNLYMKFCYVEKEISEEVTVDDNKSTKKGVDDGSVGPDDPTEQNKEVKKAIEMDSSC